MKPAVFIPALCFLAGCCGDGALDLVEGQLPVAPGGKVSFDFSFDGDFIAGPEKCRGYWYVNDRLWGSLETGTVTDCGVFTAPDDPPCPGVTLSAMEYMSGQCADCCPYATKSISFANCTEPPTGADSDGEVQ